MKFVLPATEEPYGPNCAKCELFADSKCLGVSTVRVVIGMATKVEESVLEGGFVDLRPMKDTKVNRSFRILQKRMAECPGPGFDAEGDFRKSNDRLSGYSAAVIIKTARTQLRIPEPQSRDTSKELVVRQSQTFDVQSAR